MSNIHPFELYKMYLYLRLHFTHINFIYGINNLPHIKYENFYRSTSNAFFTKWANTVKQEYAEALFIANFIDNPKTLFYDLNSTQAREVMKDWEYRIKHIGKIFIKDMNSFMRKHKIDSFEDFKERFMAVPYMNETIKVNIYQASKIQFKQEQKFHVDLVSSFKPESVVLLNKMIKRKYNVNVLLECVEKKLTPKTYFVSNYKYSEFIDLDYCIKNEKCLEEFYNII